MKHVNVLISFFIFFSLISLLFFVSPVFASATYSYGFESSTLGQQVLIAQSGGWLNSYSYSLFGATFQVSNQNPKTGTKSFRFEGSGTGTAGQFNFTYSPSAFLTSFSYSVYHTYSSGNADIYEKYYDNSSNLIISFWKHFASPSTLTMYYYDYLHVAHVLGGGTGRHEISFTFTANDSVTYVYDSTVIVDTPYTILDTPRINKCVFSDSAVAGYSKNDFDDLNMTYDNAFPTGGTGTYPYGDVSLFDSNCEEYSQTFTSATYTSGGHTYDGEVIEQLYDFDVNQVIHAVDLYVSTDQIGYVSGNVLEYELTINGVYVGSPTYIFLDNDLVSYVIRWYNINVNITNDKPLFEFRCLATFVLLPRTYRWYGVGVSVGNPTFKTGNSNYENGVFDGFAPIGMDGKRIRMCYFSLPSSVPSPYTDNISATPKTQELFSSVTLYGSISADSYITIWKSGVKIFNDGYGTTDVFVKQPTFAISFIGGTLGDIGSYTATIQRSGINRSSCTFNIVSSSNSDYQVYAQPNPFNGYPERLNVSWKYKYDGVIKGAVVYSSLSYFDSANFYIMQTGITENGSVILDHLASGFNIFYIYLVEVFGNGSFNVKDTYTLMVGAYTGGISEIHANPQNSALQLIDGEYKSYISLYGKNGALGLPVYICINGYKHQDVTGISDFSYENIWICYTPSIYNVSLMVLDASGTPRITLATVTVTVLGYGSTIPGETPETPSLIDSIPFEFKILIGVILTVVFTLIPLIVSALLSKKTSIQIINIPGLVYVAFFLLGVITSTVLKLFDIWIIFFIMFALILVFAITWIQRKIAE
jgi:hypothetical protein